MFISIIIRYFSISSDIVMCIPIDSVAHAPFTVVGVWHISLPRRTIKIALNTQQGKVR